MRLLVTGGAGYVGSVVTARLLAAGHDVIVVDDLSTGHADAVPAGATFHRAQLTDLSGVLDAAALDGTTLDGVLHFAARSLVGESALDPAGYWHNNVGGTLALLDAMRSHGIARIVFSSTAAVYGQPEQTPIEESAPTAPTNPYGASKLAVDLALASYAGAYDMTAVSLRYFNVAGALYGGATGYGERHRLETHLIPLALRARTSQPLKIFGTDYPTPDGTCVRDYVHVVDLADAHIRALTHGQPGEHHVFNLGSGSGYSVREVIEAVSAVTGRRVPVQIAPRRPGDPAILVAANARAESVLGWVPKRQLTEMVEDASRFEARRS
ncbi:MAG: UDP-glucose 4-epimerase GalE [Actinomycetota bacterium]|nr:UDP-glucose 4-epimerase GalE [Actinomycetota bacterium]